MSRRPRTLLLAAATAVASLCALPAVRAQQVLFDFNNAPIHTPLPIDLTVGGVTGHFSGTGQGFSIQGPGVPIYPVGFSGNFIYPSSVFAADLVVSFSRTLTDFSTLYAVNELACDDSATVRVTAYMNGVLVGTATMTAHNPGTYPVDTLSCSFPQGFNSVVVHWDHKGPTCQDYGVELFIDDLRVTPMPTDPWTDLGSGLAGLSGVPLLAGAGTLATHSAGSLTLSAARPASFAMLFVSLGSAAVPFKCGLLVPLPVAFELPVTTSASGSVHLVWTNWPGGLSGAALAFQFAILDAAAPCGVALSNAVRGNVP